MNEFERRGIQEANLEALARNKAFKFTNTFFPYTSGEIGPYYINSEAIMKNPSDFKLAIECYADLVSYVMRTVDDYTIAGGESRDWIFSNALIKEIGKPAIMIYKDKKIIPFSDEEIKGRTFVITSDLNNEGSSPRDKWVPAIRERGGIVKNALFYIDRLEGGIEVMKDLELYSDSVVPLNIFAWKYLQKTGVIDEPIYRNLRNRGKTKEERDAWAIKMLRSNVGIATLGSLLMNPKTQEKGINIINKGYPEIKDELSNRLISYEKGISLFLK
ncbi:MAG: hypothetical protein WC867_08730 [Candidatus Pacearchaeota archaeon]|jgi:orotate phosphoribosyltransferase